MSETLGQKILAHVKSERYRPEIPRRLAASLEMDRDAHYPAFREALRELMHSGHVLLGAGGAVVLQNRTIANDEFIGTFRQNKRGFGFIISTDPGEREDLFIPETHTGGAVTGDVVRARITSRGHRDGKAMTAGKIVQVITRTHKRFAGTLQKNGGKWVVLPDGNIIAEPILTPDAGSRHLKPGTKVVVELTQYPAPNTPAQGVITEVIGLSGEKDVDLKSVIVQYNLPGAFPEDVLAQARRAVDLFDADGEKSRRLDLAEDVICTIDPDDAKDYDDAISLRSLPDGEVELGVHIADVSHFVPLGTPLDVEAAQRGNSCYFPGHVIPMLPEVLSNGVCSLQEAVPRLCKSAFITLDADARPVRTRVANSVIRSAKRLRYTEAQAIIDRADRIPHPDGARKLSDYPPEVIDLLDRMDSLAKRIQKRRIAAGQLNLNLPEVELVLDEEGRVVDAVPEDQSFTHTLIEMFMVEANEAVARLLDSQNVAFIRRVHPDPDDSDNERLRQFVKVAGYTIPKELDRKGIQTLLTAAKGKPEEFAINLAVLKSLTRAEYSPKTVGHYALASAHYTHFTSPIRRYADLMIHRLLDRYLDQTRNGESKPRKKVDFSGAPSEKDLFEAGKRISFTERRAEDAEKELRKVKILELMAQKVGQEFAGVITGITSFGIFIQLSPYLIDGLVRYQQLMDDWWDVDEKAGVVRGQRTGTRMGIGDVVRVKVAAVDVPRRELDLLVLQVTAHGPRPTTGPVTAERSRAPGRPHRGGGGNKSAKMPKLPKGQTHRKGPTSPKAGPPARNPSSQKNPQGNRRGRR